MALLIGDHKHEVCENPFVGLPSTDSMHRYSKVPIIFRHLCPQRTPPWLLSVYFRLSGSLNLYRFNNQPPKEQKLITGLKTDKPQIYDLVLIMSHYNCPLLRTVSPTITPEIKSCPKDYG